MEGLRERKGGKERDKGRCIGRGGVREIETRVSLNNAPMNGFVLHI